MTSTGETYSSAHLRERDKCLIERHQKELAVVERKADRLKSTNTDLLKHLYDAQHRGHRLAMSLGFNDINEALAEIQDADKQYRDCIDGFDDLQSELAKEKSENVKLRGELKRVEEERDREKANALAMEKIHAENRTLSSVPSTSKSPSHALSLELAQLRERFDSLVDVKERAAARYKVDYKKWRDFKMWLFAEEERNVKDKKNSEICEKERKERHVMSVMKKRKMMVEIGPDLSKFEEENGLDKELNRTNPEPLFIADPESDKENQDTPVPFNKKHRLHTSLPVMLPSVPPSSTAAASPIFVLDPNSPLAANTTVLPCLPKSALSDASTSPALPHDPTSAMTSTTRIRPPLPFQPTSIANSAAAAPVPHITQESRSPPIPSSARSLKRQHPHTALVPNSSDTEEDSQAHHPVSVPMFKIPPPPTSIPNPKHTIPGGSSDTEDDSQMPFPTPAISTPKPALNPIRNPQPQKFSTHPTLPPRPSFSQFEHKDWSSTNTVTPSHASDPQRPHKIRRLSVNEVVAARASSNATGSAVNGSYGRNRSTSQRDRSGARGGGKDLQGVRKGFERTPREKDRGKAKEKQGDTSTPTSSNSNQRRLGDYSAYKGRGRYAKATSANKSINAAYVIDPSRNKGLDFQYDEVVRGKEDRRRMNAGDCECCRDYYEGVGPLPKRLEQPLWRSPPVSPAKPCSRHPGSNHANTSDRDQAINSHKQAISRHRHHWARASTPPGYWNIGFPDTQEAEDINERAREMHRKKREEVEGEAKKGEGRYRKR